MKRHLASAAVAALLTAIAFLDLIVAPVWRPWHWPWALQLLVYVVSWTSLPAMLILSVFGVHGGPDGMPDFTKTAILTLLLWWGALDFGPAAWKRLTNKSGPER